MQLTVRDVAQFLGVSERTVYRYIQSNSIPAYKIQEQYRFNRAEILEWATSRRMTVHPEIFHEPETSAVPLPTVTDSIRMGGIHYRLEGNDKASVLKNMVDTMHIPAEVDRDYLYKVLLAREALASTGIGEGIAIPHVRNPIVLNVASPLLALFFLENQIDFEAIDGKPVFCLFTLISPTVRAHLHLLSRLSFALKNGSFREMLTQQASREEIFRGIAEIEASF